MLDVVRKGRPCRMLEVYYLGSLSTLHAGSNLVQSVERIRRIGLDAFAGNISGLIPNKYVMIIFVCSSPALQQWQCLGSHGQSRSR